MNYRNVPSAFYGCVHSLMVQGNRSTPRGMKTREILHANFSIMHPHERFVLHSARKANPVAQIAETMWMLAGRNDLDWLVNYIPQASKWSDDGDTWRGAYGPRLRKWKGDWHVGPQDQFGYVIHKLQEDPESRQAVISIWDPTIDTLPGKDIPCNNWLHFLIRNNALHLNVAIRSNDIVYGFSHVDAFSWSVLQETLAAILGVGVGRMIWNASSLHIYERHFQMADDLIRNGPADPLAAIYSLDDIVRLQPEPETLPEFDLILREYFQIELQARLGHFKQAVDMTESFFSDFAFDENGLFRAFSLATVAYQSWKQTQDTDAIREILELLPTCDVKFAVREWINRQSQRT